MHLQIRILYLLSQIVFSPSLSLSHPLSFRAIKIPLQTERGMEYVQVDDEKEESAGFPFEIENSSD